jgi:hypothetical protein
VPELRNLFWLARQAKKGRLTAERQSGLVMMARPAA